MLATANIYFRTGAVRKLIFGVRKRKLEFLKQMIKKYFSMNAQHDISKGSSWK